MYVHRSIRVCMYVFVRTCTHAYIDVPWYPFEESVLPNSGHPIGLREGEAWQCPICLTGRGHPRTWQSRANVSVCLYMYVHICIYIYVCVYVYMYTSMHICMWVCRHVGMPVCVYVGMCSTVFGHIQIHVIYIYMYTCSNTRQDTGF